MSSFKFRVITPYGEFYNGLVESVNIKTKEGRIGILKNHIPLVAPVEISILYFRVEGVEKKCAISDGILYIGEDETRVIANACEYPEDINTERALESKSRAEARLAGKLEDNIDLRRAECSLKRAMNRIEITK